MTLLQDRIYDTASACRISGSRHVVDVLQLGAQPLANSLKDAATGAEVRVPLTLGFCPDSSLVQIRETVRKEILFSNYVWVSGTSETTRRWAEQFARAVVDLGRLLPDELVVEIASNDGTFLKPFIAGGYRHVVGVDPATNIADIAVRAGVPTVNAFWGREIADRVVQQHGQAKVLFARNVIAHTSEVHDVMSGIELALRPDGIGVFEFHYAAEILNGLQYDSIYHEHLCYFSLGSIENLLRRSGFTAFHADFSPISGGALVVYFSRQRREPSQALLDVADAEERDRVNRLDTWQRFADACVVHRRDSTELVASLSGRRIVGYGSSARSATYINYCGFDATQIAAVIDNSPLKQGKFTPGSSIPIVSLEEGLRQSPDYIFVFAWNFRDEIVTSCRRAGYQGRFITAFPGAPAVWD